MPNTNSLKSRKFALISAICLLTFGIFPLKSYGQLVNSGEFIRAGTEDAEKLFREYLRPFGKGFGPALNSSWVHSAKPHKKLGFHLSVRAGFSIVPSADQSFDVTSLNYNNVRYDPQSPGASPITPTIVGEAETGAHMAVEGTVPGSNQTVKLDDFNMPEGIGYNYVPAPIVQGGVGLFKDTEVMVRYMPPVSMPFDGSINLIGGGIKHGLNQWLPGGNMLPVDLSIMLGYTSLDVTANLDVQPNVDSNTRNPYENQPQTWEGQEIAMGSEAFTAMALVGKNLPFISLYGGVGYETSSLDFDVNGSYPVNAPDDPSNPNYEAGKVKVVKKVDDPVSLSYDGANSMKMMAGFRLRLAVFSINVDYTLGNYSVATAGIGISFR